MGAFLFESKGQLPARDVETFCRFDHFTSQNGRLTIDGTTFFSPSIDRVWGHDPFSADCSVSAPGQTPVSGNVTVGVVYHYPFPWWEQLYETHWEFRFDSQSGGYVFVRQRKR